MKNNIKNGFTLAEVLVTLAILGVVAAVTLPNMVQGTQYQQLGVKLSKFASTLENAATAYAIGIGGNFSHSTSVNSGDFYDFIANSFIFASKTSDSILLNNNEVGASTPGYLELKDGSQVQFAEMTSTRNDWNLPSSVNTLQVGNYFAAADYIPKVKGLHSSIDASGYRFIITSKGYVYPSGGDSCLSDIVSKNYKVTPDMFKTGASCASKK